MNTFYLLGCTGILCNAIYSCTGHPIMAIMWLIYAIIMFILGFYSKEVRI